MKKETATLALVGNPNVGKSTLFNALTGLRQHTGNWTGKTVQTAVGYHTFEGKTYTLVDLPGVYSLSERSAEEKVALDYLRSGMADTVIFICDATALARSLSLLFSVISITPRVLVCLNLMDEAKRQGIYVDAKKLEKMLELPVIPMSASKKEGISAIFPRLLHDFSSRPKESIPLEKDAAWRTEYAKAIADTVTQKEKSASRKDLLLRARFGIPAIFLLLALVLWLTVAGANAPSSWLSAIFSAFEPILYDLCVDTGMGVFMAELITCGFYRTVTWIIAVMLPPMAIFFPLFTILEDVGLLPRMAFHADGLFEGCGSCGKQGLCMCMGLGCNAVGVTGARIMDSKRERLLSILTAGFMPCNGRFPAMIAVATLFFAGTGIFSSLSTALILLLSLLLGVFATWICAKILARTFLKGTPSSFVLELPPYRRPRILQIIVRSLLDRTLFVLGRAISVAAPAGILIFLLARVTVADAPILSHICVFLEPFGALMGMDGTLLLAFLLGLPAAEIVLPIAVMLYSGSGVLSPIADLASLSTLLIGHGWTTKTALCFLIFSVLRSPCTTTLLTVKKETGAWRYAFLSFFIPTVFGILACMLCNFVISHFS